LISQKDIAVFINDYHLLAAFIVLLIGVLFAQFTRRLLNKFLEKSSDHLKVDPTQYNFLKNASTTIIMAGAIAYVFQIIPSLKVLGTTIFAGAGVAAAVVAFASQQAIGNLVHGIFLVIYKPFRVGDLIEVGTLHQGVVVDITLRHTVIRSFENEHIIIPNGVIGSETILNSNIKEDKVCRFIEFGISYDSNVETAKRIIRQEATKHAAFIDNRTPLEKSNEEEVLVIRMVEHGDFSVTLRAYFWAKDPMSALIAHYDLLESVKREFENNGIEIPYPYRTIVQKN
jgi:small-conductance mechanosensitive channel